MYCCVITSSFPSHPSDAAAAAGLFVRDFCLALAELDCEVVVVTQDKPGIAKQSIEGVRVEWFPWLGDDRPLSLLNPYRPADALRMLSWFRGGARQLDELASNRPFDHVIAMWAAPAGLLAARHRRRHATPYTTWCLGSDIWNYGRHPVLKHILKRVIRASDLVYADGLELAESVRKLASRACPFLASSRRLDQALVRDLELPGDRPHFLFIGRYHPVKGVDVLLEAMAEYRSGGGGGHLHLFGGGPDEASVRARAGESDLRDAVSVGGFADEETYLSYLKACDVVVIPSRMESIPLVLSDALQMGKPVIVSDAGDMGALLREHPAGRVVACGDSGALARAMADLVALNAEEFRSPIESLARTFDLRSSAEHWLADARTKAR